MNGNDVNGNETPARGLELHNNGTPREEGRKRKEKKRKKR